MEIKRDIYVLANKIKVPIDYTRGTNTVDMLYRFRDYQIPEGSTAKVYVQKPSGKAVYNNAVIEGNDVRVEVTTQMVAELGKNILQLRVEKGEKVLVTFDQPIYVHSNYTDGDAPESENESGFFEEYEKKLDDAIEKADTATKGADTAAGKANEAAEAANKATTAANEAATAANEAAKDVGVAIENANTAAENANSKAESADTAAKKANTAATTANKAAEDVKKRADSGEFTSSIEVGTVTTGEPGTKAEVKQRGTGKDAIFDFIIPQGETGEVENIDTVTVAFTQASTRENINSGETFAVIFGKVKKFFADIKAAAFQNVANNTTTTAAGSVLDARQGKALEDKKLDKAKIANNSTTTVEGYALDAREGKRHQEQIDALTSNSTPIEIELTRITTNNPTGSAYKCVYIPALKMCFARIYIEARSNKTFAENEDYPLYTVPEGYRPAKIHALTVAVSGDSAPDARITNDGNIIIRPRLADVEKTRTPYITGFWMVE